MRVTNHLRFPLVCLLVTGLIAGLATACDGEEEETATATPVTATLTPAAVATPTVVAVPPQPGDFADYPAAIADYLTAAGGSPSCLAELFAVWEMPTTVPEWAEEQGAVDCAAGDLDGDGEDEYLVRLTDPVAAVGSIGPFNKAKVFIFDRRATGYDVAFQPGLGGWVELVILGIRDYNGDGKVEASFAATTFGMQYWTYVDILAWSGQQYVDLLQDDYRWIGGPDDTVGLGVPNARDIYFMDWEDDGIEELVAEGQNPHADGAEDVSLTYVWDGISYVLVAPEYEPSAPAAGMIAFESDRDGVGQIYVMNADGSGQTNLTNNFSANESTPVWSPDGFKIAFVYGNDDIYVINADGSGQTNLTNNPAWDTAPAWSPDGSKIAFDTSRGGTDHWEIYVMNADGSGQTNLTNVSGFSSAWSPDGSKIAFGSDRHGNSEIYVMNADGSGQTNLTNNPASIDMTPVWSPDGTRIAFESDRDGVGEIYVMNADGSGQTNLTNYPAANDMTPVWSPDGSKIAFGSERDGEGEVYVMNADGSGQTNLTNHPAVDVSPAWSPDGTRIAFQSYRDGNSEIYVMNADGSGQTNLTDNPAWDHEPAWSP